MARSLVRTLSPLLAPAALFFGSNPASGPPEAAAQVIQVKTVPVAAGDQFLALPSVSLGMGGVRLAVDDSLADPWSNPAKGVFIAEPALISSPTFYAISENGGAGRTFPVAALFKGGRWFGGAALALQQIHNTSMRDDWIWRSSLPWPPGGAQRLSDASNRNLYAQGMVGARLGEGPWSVGIGVSGAALRAVDGVDLLYANAVDIRQSGTVGDVRLGAYRQGGRDRVGLVVVHDRVSMTHDVEYLDVSWDAVPMVPELRRRVEVNQDHTRTWGAEASWDRELAAPGWRLGTLLAMNRKSHPKIPNYEIQNIPRDPGTTWAWEAGMGVSRQRGATTFGLDVILQPIWSETWQEAEEPTSTASGGVIPVGGRTIDNDFFFTNVFLRAGLSHDIGRATLQAGVELRSYDYALEQRDNVAVSFREQDESWMEWIPALGASVRMADLELRYAGRLTTGTGRPGVALTAVAEAARLAVSDFILAPSGPLTLQDATVVTHQFSVRVPIR